MRSTIASSISSGCHGERGSRLAAESHTAAIDRIESIVSRERIACDFIAPRRLPVLRARSTTRRFSIASWRRSHRAGLHNVAKIGRAPLAFDTGPCLRFPNQAQFHPLKYLAGLAEAIERAGGRIYTGTHATKIEGGERRRSRRPHGGTVRAGSIVVATNVPVNDLVVVHTKQAPYMTYVIGAPVPRSAVTTALYWDTGDPYHYVRLRDGDRCRPRSADRRRRGSQERAGRRHRRSGIRASKRWARERFPIDGRGRRTSGAGR